MFPTLREIPNKIEKYADHIHEARCLSQSQIYHALVEHGVKDGIPQTFIQLDIKNKYNTQHGDAILDCTNLAEHLKQHQLQDPELDYAIELDRTNGNLQLIFLVPHKFVSSYWCVTYVLQYTHIASQFLRMVSLERNNVAVETIGSERNHLYVI